MRIPFSTLAIVRKPAHTRRVVSESDPTVTYEVVVSCTCPGFTFKGRCKHIIRILKEG
jgi:hypothetical protein